MRDAQPVTVYLKDYLPPEYLIDEIDLRIELGEQCTRVTSMLSIRKNEQANLSGNGLELVGEELELEQLSLDGKILSSQDYQLSKTSLTIPSVPDVFQLEVVTTLNPSANTSLEGLYLSKGMFCTQCEAEGFRKITYYLDRPDVMARFTTTLVADQHHYPVLLSNGNPIDQGHDPESGMHWVKWEDPYRKPCYLFALVAGNLDCLEDQYTTLSGRRINLQIFAESHDLDKCEHAMAALKKSMLWDEQVYGREYDLDLYMIVAVSHFNMGAMENKGLNIFNTKFVLARPDTATDTDFEHVEGVIAHEYFHNWTGNRITCRDWFQLSLKEGFTVFRDQEFSADQGSRGVKRINDVNFLRSRQFAEDAGPLAHPIRPDSYMEINNFYTLTVYEKGAEVVRMIHTLLGPGGFRKGSDLYFERHDGQAVTTDDFVQAMEDANGFDLSQFRRWYSQAGTPVVEAESHFDAEKNVFTLTLKQHTPPTPGQKDKLPLFIPIAMACYSETGEALTLTNEAGESFSEQIVLHFTGAEQTFCFSKVASQPVLSLLRGFSAPVKLQYSWSNAELGILLAHDSDQFSRWEAGQTLVSRIILNNVKRLQNQQKVEEIPDTFLDAFSAVLTQSFNDQAYQALLLSLPSESYLAEQMDEVDPDAIYLARTTLQKMLATHFRQDFERIYQLNHHPDTDVPTVETSAARALKNVSLDYLASLDDEPAWQLISQQYDTAGNMTDQFAALSALEESNSPDREKYLQDFYDQWQDEALVIDKWFALQSSSRRADVMSIINQLLDHPAFDMRTPNRVRSIVGAFSMNNPLHFHAKSGAGYQFLADQVISLNAINPQVASRMLSALTHWRRYDERRQDLMKSQLERIMQTENISRDVYEIASKSLG